MTTTHTPGPWQAKDSLTRWHVTTITTPRTYNICSINAERIEQEANARLIAAAPALLEACQDLRYNLEQLKPQARHDLALAVTFDKVRAALAQAEGREP